ncbi:carboxypeptidase-like regulatory domain-containing protein, partial [Flavobacterium xinjiangense]
MNTKLIYFVTLTLLLSVSSMFSQEKCTLSGTVSDAKSNETIIGVNVYIPELKTGTTTNEYGFYSITIPKGNYRVQVSSVSFQTITESVNLDKNTKNNFKLFSSEEQLQEVVIKKDRKATNIKK